MLELILVDDQVTLRRHIFAQRVAHIEVHVLRGVEQEVFAALFVLEANLVEIAAALAAQGADAKGLLSDAPPAALGPLSR